MCRNAALRSIKDLTALTLNFDSSGLEMVVWRALGGPPEVV